MSYLPDEIKFENNYFTGKVFFYLAPDFNNPQHLEFKINMTDQLEPFYYTKPIENPENNFAPPLRFERDLQPKTGFYPLLIVHNSRRPPNHMYEDNEGLFTTTNRGNDSNPNWVVRYFPKSGLEPKTWNEAVELITQNT